MRVTRGLDGKLPWVAGQHDLQELFDSVLLLSG
jgi:hypothetical protein